MVRRVIQSILNKVNFVLGKLHTLFWFSRNPLFYPHALELAKRFFRDCYDTPKHQEEATRWASSRVVSLSEALSRLGVRGTGELPLIPEDLLYFGRDRVKLSPVELGGEGDLSLIYALIKLNDVRTVLETGVAYGWSSLIILSALDQRPGSRLVSIDMPYPKLNNEEYVGIVVPQSLRQNWTLIREPDRYGIQKGISLVDDGFDLCHYDSDKSWWGRHYGYPLLWEALKPGGIFISDDIQDNMYFAYFVEQMNIPHAVTYNNGKYIGISVKV